MDIDPISLKDKSKREVLRELIEYVVHSDEEIEAKTTQSGEQTDLNLYLCDNKGYDIGELDDWVHHLAESNRVSEHASNYVKEHTFREEVTGNDTALVTITTLAKGREDEFVFVLNNGRNVSVSNLSAMFY